MSDKTEQLTRVFRNLGAPDPELWAQSQAEQGIPQIHRFLFLRQAWALVASEQDDAWLDGLVDRFRQHPTAPYAGAGRAIERMIERGVERTDIVDLVRAMQAELLFGVCYLLEDANLCDEDDEAIAETGWALVAADAEGEPTKQIIGGLHESVLETDPTGREMRPR